MKPPRYNAYWKVHKNDIESMKIIQLPDHFIEAWKDGSACIDNYMYISFEFENNKKSWGFMFYNPESIIWFSRHKFIYQGGFNIKEIRRQKLKKINDGI